MKAQQNKTNKKKVILYNNLPVQYQSGHICTRKASPQDNKEIMKNTVYHPIKQSNSSLAKGKGNVTHPAWRNM